MAQDLQEALKAFAKLIGLLDADTEAIQWTWFGDPYTNSLNAMPAQRAELGALLQNLLGTDSGAANFGDATASWVPSAGLGSNYVGPVWSADPNPATKPLPIGFGLGAPKDTTGPAPALTLLAQLLKITPGSGNVAPRIDSPIGQGSFSASLPVPQPFLQSLRLTGSYTNKLSVQLAATGKSDPTVKTLDSASPTLAWDIARLAAFVVRAWVGWEAANAGGTVFQILDQYLFPLLGASPQPSTFPPLPPFDGMGGQPDFKAWQQAITNAVSSASKSNPSSAIAQQAIPSSISTSTLANDFLWYLRALICGYTGTGALSDANGNIFLPLTGPASPLSSTPATPPGTFSSTGVYPPASDQAGAWLYLRLDASSQPSSLGIEFRGGSVPSVAGKVYSLDILSLKSGTPMRPTAINLPLLSSMLAAVPLTYGAGSIKAASVPLEALPGSVAFSIFSAPVADAQNSPLSGTYSFGFLLEPGKPIEFRINTPLLSLAFPPDSAATNDPLHQLLSCIINYLPADQSHAGDPLHAAAAAVRDLATNALQKPPAPPSGTDILNAAASLLTVAGQVHRGDISLDLSQAGSVTGGLTIGPVAPSALESLGISIGSLALKATTTFSPAPPAFTFLSLTLSDVRLSKDKNSGISGLVAQIFPDLRNVEGFTVALGYDFAKHAFTISGGGKIPIQLKLGPLDLSSLSVEFDTDSLNVGVDLSFSLGPISIQAYELGIAMGFKKGDLPKLFLHGLGLSFDGGGITLSGLFLETKSAAGTDYVGAAVVSVVDLFQLSAIGGYANDKNGDASLFIFASLVAPLGGPPWFFITGVAGGFGYNRNLPSPKLLGDHPFLKVMRGDIKFNPNDKSGTLTNIGSAFTLQKGQYWIAAGLQFTCFAMIDGKVIVAVSFGKKFSFNLLGMLSFGLKPVAYFELDFMMTADEEHFLLIAGMSPNSYLIDPDIFSLQGQFGMGVWYAAPHAGDFVVSIGGYHPYFKVPDHYPALARVGVKAKLFGFVHVDVQCFFACTPRALMAGAAVSLSATFAGISAGLDVYVDVLIQWDPFYLVARMGVTVWFVFFGRHEIGVQLEIHTPPFGGTAKIELFIVSFTISFGSDVSKKPAPALAELLSRQIGVAASPWGQTQALAGGKPVAGAKVTGAHLAAFNTGTAPGLFLVEVTQGRAVKAPGTSKEQEGIQQGSPIQVNPEFTFTVKTKLPIFEMGVDADLKHSPVLNGYVNLPLCDYLMEKPSTFTVGANKIASAGLTRMIDFFPAATFGDKLEAVQGDSSVRDSIRKLPTDTPAVPRSQGIEVNYAAIPDPTVSGYLKSNGEEYSNAGDGQECPLPLAWTKPSKQPMRSTVSEIYFANMPSTKVAAKVNRTSSREMATSAVAKLTVPPWSITITMADVLRPTVTVSPRVITVVNIPASASVISVPRSPVRRSELLPVMLQITPVRSATTVRLAEVPALTKGTVVSRRVPVLGSLPARPGAKGMTVTSAPAASKTPDLTLLPGRVGHLLVKGGSPGAIHHFTVTGEGTLRALFFAGGQEFLEDRYLTAGQSLAMPAGTREVLFLHQGTLSPIRLSAAGTLLPSGIAESVGVESDSLAHALGAKTFAAHGCVVQTSIPLLTGATAFDTLSGARLLRSLSSFRVAFPMVQAGSTLVMIVEPVVTAPGSALSQVRWTANNATLGDLSTVVSPGRTAFLCSVVSSAPWRLEVDLGKDWRVTSVVVTPTSARELTTQFAASSEWSMVDDRVQTGNQASPLNIVFEVSQ